MTPQPRVGQGEAMAKIVLRIQLTGGGRMDVAYGEPGTSDADQLLEQVGTAFADDSGVLRVQHGDRLAVMHADKYGHAEEHLLNSLGRDNILEIYSEFQPCRNRCTPLLHGIPTSWSWDWTTSSAGAASQRARR